RLPRLPSSYLSILPLRHPPTTTLSPYTTLFRSRGCGSRHPRDLGLEPGQRDPPGHRQARSRRPRVHDGGVRGLRATAGVPADRQDRKSTRLNSSHVKISYAVFCLKKKNKPQERI